MTRNGGKKEPAKYGGIGIINIRMRAAPRSSINRISSNETATYQHINVGISIETGENNLAPLAWRIIERVAGAAPSRVWRRYRGIKASAASIWKRNRAIIISTKPAASGERSGK